MSTAGQFHFVNSVVKGVDDDYNTRILKAVRNVTVDEIKRVMKEVLLPAFAPGVSNVVVTCAPIMEEVSFPFLFPSSFVFLDVLYVLRKLHLRLCPYISIPRSTVSGIPLLHLSSCFSLEPGSWPRAAAVLPRSVKSYNVPALHQDATSFSFPMLLPSQLTLSTISHPLSRIKHRLTRDQSGNHQRLHSIRLQNTSPAPLRFP